MTEPPQDDPAPRWHRALVYAVTGQRHEIADPPLPDTQHVADWLRSELGSDTLSRNVQQRRAADQPWPYPVPADLMSGLGYAQFAAALTLLVQTLALEPADAGVARDVAAEASISRPPNADLRRLLEDVPPHHGG